MPRISPETIEQVAAALNIVDVVASYFPLKRAGVEFRALCLKSRSRLIFGFQGRGQAFALFFDQVEVLLHLGGRL